MEVNSSFSFWNTSKAEGDQTNARWMEVQQVNAKSCLDIIIHESSLEVVALVKPSSPVDSKKMYPRKETGKMWNSHFSILTNDWFSVFLKDSFYMLKLFSILREDGCQVEE